MKAKHSVRLFLILGALGLGSCILVIPPPALAAVANVGVSGTSFTPPTVTINVNDQVQWTWSGFHSTTSDTGLWDSTVQGPAFTFTQAFPSAGSFPYYCIPHEFLGMRGTVTVQGTVNAAPTVTITSPSDGAVFTAPWSGTIQATATDSDGSVAKVDFFAGPNQLGTVDNPPASFSFPVPNLAAGGYVLTAVATDNGGAMTTSSGVSITVNSVNTPPVLTVPPDQTINELANLSVSASAIDTDVPANVLTFALISAPPDMSINPASGLITWAPTEVQGPSTNRIEIQVSDNGTPGMSATQSFNVVVHELNSPPLLTVPGDQTVNELATLTVTNTASDPDIPANPLTFALVSEPGGMTIDAINGVIQWTPAESQSPSTNIIQVSVTDTNPDAMDANSLSVTNSFIIVVIQGNRVPVLPTITDQTVNALTLLTVTNTATEANIHATLEYVLLNPPTGASIDTNGIITWTPAQNQSPSTNVITTVVTSTDLLDLVNPHLSATNSFTVVVIEGNRVPVLPTITDQTVNALTLLTVTNTATEASIHATLEYTLLDPPIGASIDTNGIITWTPAQNQSPSTNVITTVVTSTDLLDFVNPHLSSTNNFTVIVNATVPVQPILGVTSVSSSNLTLSWTASPGSTYRVQHNPDLNPTNWIDLDGDITAETNSASMSDVLTTTNQFYRVRLLP